MSEEKAKLKKKPKVRMVTADLVKKGYRIKMRYGTTAVQTELKCGTVQLWFYGKGGTEYCLIGDNMYLRY